MAMVPPVLMLLLLHTRVVYYRTLRHRRMPSRPASPGRCCLSGTRRLGPPALNLDAIHSASIHLQRWETPSCSGAPCGSSMLKTLTLRLRQWWQEQSRSLWTVAASAWVTRAWLKSIPTNIADDEVSVSRGRYVPYWLAKAYA